MHRSGVTGTIGLTLADFLYLPIDHNSGILQALDHSGILQALGGWYVFPHLRGVGRKVIRQAVEELRLFLRGDHGGCKRCRCCIAAIS